MQPEKNKKSRKETHKPYKYGGKLILESNFGKDGCLLGQMRV